MFKSLDLGSSKLRPSHSGDFLITSISQHQLLLCNSLPQKITSQNHLLNVPPLSYLTPSINGTTYVDHPGLSFLFEHGDSSGHPCQLLFLLGIPKDWESSIPITQKWNSVLPRQIWTYNRTYKPTWACERWWCDEKRDSDSSFVLFEEDTCHRPGELRRSSRVLLPMCHPLFDRFIEFQIAARLRYSIDTRSDPFNNDAEVMSWIIKIAVKLHADLDIWCSFRMVFRFRR